MTTLVNLYSPGEIIYTRDLEGLAVKIFVVTPQGDIVSVTQEEIR